jgi:putative ABC transport system permease protein
MPGSFGFPSSRTALWLPLPLDPAHTRSAAFDFRGIARLRPGVTLQAATQDLDRLLPQVPQIYPGRLTTGAIRITKMRAVVEPLRDVIVGNVGRVLWVVLGAVVVLLLLACANVANLFLARVEGRQRELALRRVLGAGLGTLFAEFFSEALVLSLAAAVLGLGLAALVLSVLPSLPAAASIPRLAEVRIDAVAGAVTAGIAVLVALLISLIPVVRSDAPSVAGLLRAEGRSATGARTRSVTRRGLVVGQVALAVVLVAGAGLLVRSFSRLRAVDPGFAADHALSFRLVLGRAEYPAAGDVAQLVIPALSALRALPGVTAAGVATKLPLDDESQQDSAVFVEDHPVPAGGIPAVHPIVFATPGYFRAMGIPLVAGRLYGLLDATADPATAPREVVVSQAFAERYWRGGSAVGKRIRMDRGDPWSTIVGVVGGVRGDGLERPPSQTVYAPIVTMGPSGTAWAPRDLAFVARSAGDPTELAAPIRRTVGRLVPALPIYRLMPLDALLADAEARTTFTLLLLAAAAAVALAIGAMGIYGVISYLVSLRTREIGVRLALGAVPGEVRRLVVRHAVGDAALGVIAGLAGAALLTRSLAGVLFTVSPTDPVTLAGAAALLLVVAIAASWFPARRAAALDPAGALRGE